MAGPGLLAFLEPRVAWDILQPWKCRSGASNYGQRKGSVKFVSANPVGPLNVVNARAAAVGDTLARLMRASGYQVGTEFYVNDAGNR